MTKCITWIIPNGVESDKFVAKMLKIQVGETVFCISEDLFPEDSYIPTMMRGEWREHTVTPFLDVDPDAFKHIVKHFRCQKLSDKKMNIFEHIEGKDKKSLWYTLKYLLLLEYVAMIDLSLPVFGSVGHSIAVNEGIYNIVLLSQRDTIEISGYYDDGTYTNLRISCVPNQRLELVVDTIHDRLLCGDMEHKFQLRPYNNIDGLLIIAFNLIFCSAKGDIISVVPQV